MFVVAYVNCAENKVAVLDTKDNVTEEIAAKDFCSLVQSGAITVENAMVTDNAKVLHILAPDMDDKNTFEIDVALPNDEKSIKTNGYLVDKTAGTMFDVYSVLLVGLSLYSVPYITDKWAKLFVEPTIDPESLIGRELKEFKSDGSHAKDMSAVLSFVTDRNNFLNECDDEVDEDEQEDETIVEESEEDEAEAELEAILGKADEKEDESVSEAILKEAEELEAENKPASTEQEETSKVDVENNVDESLQAVADRFSSFSESVEKDESLVSTDNALGQSKEGITEKEELVPETVQEVTPAMAEIKEEENGEEKTANIATEDASDALKAFANRYSAEPVNEGVAEEVNQGINSAVAEVESVVDEGELKDNKQSTQVETAETEYPKKEVKEMATKSKKPVSKTGSKTSKVKNSVAKTPAKSSAKTEKPVEQGIVTSKKFTLSGKKYLCEIKTENFEIGKDKVVLSKTCSDFMYFCGNDAEVFLPEACLSDIQLKDKVLSVVDTMLSGYVVDSKNNSVGLYDVCIGKNKALQIFKPYAPELGVYDKTAKKIVIFVTAL